MKSNRSPRVCLLTPIHWSAGIGGAELQIRMLLARLIERGYSDLHYVARSVASDYRPMGYSIHRVRARKAVCGTYLLELPALLATLERLRPDVIYQRVGCAYTGAAVWYARRHGRRVVWHVSSDRDLTPLAWRASPRSPIEKLNKALVGYGARHADSVIVQNRAQAELARIHYGRADAIRIPNFHAAVEALAPKPSGVTTVVWIGNVKELKQPELFVRLARDFRDRADVEFVIAGGQQMRGPAWERLMREVAELPQLRYIGFVPPEAVERLLTRAHLLVNTSQFEGYPNTFIQAWMREVPVLSLAVNPDNVFDGDRVGLYAAGSYERLRDGLARLLADASGRAAIGERARQFACDTHAAGNIDRVIDLIAGPA